MNIRLAFLFIWVACQLGQAYSQDTESIIALRQTDDGHDVFIVEDFVSRVPQRFRDSVTEMGSGDFKPFLRVSVAGERPSDIPLIGEYSLIGDQLEFRPRFDLQPGLTYRAALILEPDAESVIPIVREFEIPAVDMVAARVEAVFPTADRLPQNLLKFYVHFSQPMRRGVAYKHIHLLDGDGRRQEQSFVELPQELWDEESKRFTLLFDPGRIKRGLQPNEELGPPLLPDRRYTLVIDGDWPDAHGRPLEQKLRKTFFVTAPDRTQPDEKRWTLHRPPASSRQPLRIEFNEPLDRGMLDHAILVRDIAGNVVEGQVTVDQGERRWSFVPAADWLAGGYELEIDANLEDRCGNSLANPFEMKIENDRGDRKDEEKPFRYLEFEIRR